MEKLSFNDLPSLSFDTLRYPGTIGTVQDIAKNRYYQFDFDVYLKKFRFNLQREYVWTDKMAGEFILSVLLDKPIQPCYFNVKIDEDIAECIDGKQRILSLLRFYKNEFPIVVNDKNYYYDDLDTNVQLRIKLYDVNAYQHYEHINDKSSILSDEQKIEWFLFINCSNVPQNAEHIYQLQRKIHACQ